MYFTAGSFAFSTRLTTHCVFSWLFICWSFSFLLFTCRLDCTNPKFYWKCLTLFYVGVHFCISLYSALLPYSENIAVIFRKLEPANKHWGRLISIDINLVEDRWRRSKAPSRCFNASSEWNDYFTPFFGILIYSSIFFPGYCPAILVSHFIV